MSMSSNLSLPYAEVDVDTMTESLRMSNSVRQESAMAESDDGGSDYWAGDDVENKLVEIRAAKAAKERKSLARKGTLAVTYIRLLAFGVLVVTALVVCLGVYFYTRSDEQQDFEYVFESSAERVIESFHSSVTRLLAGMDAMSVAITSNALATGTEFPFVTVPHMELRGANARILTKSVAANYIPLVTDEKRSEWEAYATQKVTQDNLPFKTFLSDRVYSVRQDASFGMDPAKFHMPHDLSDSPLASLDFPPQLFMMNGTTQPNHTGPYLPFFQTSPALPAPSLPNMNVLSFPPLAQGARKVLETNLAYLSHAVEDPPIVFRMFLELGQYRHGTETFLGDAMTPFLYPVFNNFSETRTLVGMCVANIYWRLHFENILPNNANGIVAVLSNSGNQTFTYQLNGPKVEYVGKGDLHDPVYDRYEISADISEYLQSHASAETESYTAVPLTQEGAQYSLHIYPSAEMQQEYVTNDPLIFALVVASVFAFTSLVFLAYNCLVERRQKMVVETAVKSSAVVSNLFPEEVKDQIMENSMPPTPSKPIITRSREWRLKEPADDKPTLLPRPAVAKKYPDTTIMFADVAGFTSWSAKREPEQVFHLLETLYAAFDALASKMGVYKIETIGDCYLAATGLPQPQADHGIRMARFARECMRQVKTLTTSLASSGLGQDTALLAFRVGLHSGAVTGGVLRGDRSRFQLFGDTVNTAARMESHGVRGKIHESMATAQELIKHKKSHILVERQAKIHAKGKGYLQTYFLSDSFVNAGSMNGSHKSSGTTSSLSESNTSFSTTHLSRHPIQEETSMRDDSMNDLPYAPRTMGHSVSYDSLSEWF